MSEETKQRIKILTARAEEYYEKQPDLKKLVDKLLAIDGDVVCVGFEEDLDKLLSRGELFSGKGSKLMKGQPSQCHSNSSELWDLNKKKVELVTGYAMSKDNDGLKVWRCHSWLIEKSSGKVIETTVKRKLYFGFKMTTEESSKFYFDNY